MKPSDQSIIPSDDHLTEERLESRIMHKGLFFDVWRDKVRLPDNNTSLREYIRHPGAVVILPMLDDGRLILERQFRYPLGRTFLEFPAGKLDAGEEPLDCARRELTEETGYTASEWHFICTVNNAIGYSDESLYLYLARGLRPGADHPDAEEFIETFSATLPELLDWVKSGRVTDAKTIIGAFWLEKINTGQWGL
ncbi:MAG: NUDIX hydrolase [Burkholderiaceae bacterium]|jgi:ADP-ribose pyrophosphatase|nr:NUDIX hydrolase [Burkholderiaceae bacterium]